MHLFDPDIWFIMQVIFPCAFAHWAVIDVDRRLVFTSMVMIIQVQLSKRSLRLQINSKYLNVIDLVLLTRARLMVSCCLINNCSLVFFGLNLRWWCRVCKCKSKVTTWQSQVTCGSVTVELYHDVS